MAKFHLLLFISVTLLVTWAYSIQSQGGLRFSGNEKMIVHRNSIFRKILLKKENRDYPLKIYKVIPWAVNFVLFLIVILIYAIYAMFYQSPIGVIVKVFLESTTAQIVGCIWCLLNFLYIGIMNAI